MRRISTTTVTACGLILLAVGAWQWDRAGRPLSFGEQRVSVVDADRKFPPATGAAVFPVQWELRNTSLKSVRVVGLAEC
jgi:hypothetical protein